MAQKFVLEQIEEMNHQMVEPRGQAKFFDLTENPDERPRRAARERDDQEPVTPSHRGEPDQEPSASTPGPPLAAHEIPVTRDDDAELQARARAAAAGALLGLFGGILAAQVLDVVEVARALEGAHEVAQSLERVG